MAFVIASAALLRVHWDYQRASRGARAQEVRIKEAEGQARQSVEFHDFVKAQLRIVVERANLLMVKAEGRANMLYGVGTILTLVSVVAPAVAIVAYVNTDPLPARVLTALLSLRNAEGAFPEGISLSLSKDWHVLIAGMSFGFLFLAASAALFAQHRRQMDAVFLLAADVDFFNRVIAAVDIAERSDTSAPKPTMARVAGLVISELLQRPQQRKGMKAEDEPSGAVQEQLKKLFELMKKSKED